MPIGQGITGLRRNLAARASLLRRVALVWLVGAIAGLVVLGFVLGVPRSPEMGAAEAPIQYALLVTVGIGGIVAMKAPGLGGTMVTLAAFGTGVYAAVEFHPVVAFAATVVLLVPGVLLWAMWQGDHGNAAVAALAVLMVVLLAGGYLAASTFYDTYYGASHRESSARLADSDTEWVWSGATTDHSAVVVAKPSQGRGVVSLAVWPDGGGEAWTVDGIEAAGGAVRFDVEELEPGSRYSYALVVAGRRDDIRVGTFTTSVTGPESFTVAFGSCARTGTNGAVFDAIRTVEPIAFIEYGDLFYGDVAAPDLDRYRDLYDGLLTAPGPQALFLDVPVVYVWDDHDFGTNDSHRASPGGPAAATVYREIVPHHRLPSDNGGVYQSFSIGRVRFIATDARFDRDAKSVPDGPGKTMLGDEQKAWFLAELETAATSSAMVVWINPVPWLVASAPGDDSWGGYTYERKQIADAIGRLGLAGRLVMLSGDAHMVAIDDGSHTDYSTAGDAGFVLIQAAALDRIGSLKGGPYSEGAHPGGGQFGTLEVVDTGTTMEVTLAGRNWEAATVVTYHFTVPVPEGTP